MGKTRWESVCARIGTWLLSIMLAVTLTPVGWLGFSVQDAYAGTQEAVSAAGGSFDSNDAAGAVAAFGGSDCAEAVYAEGVLTIDIKTDIQLEEPAGIRRGASSDIVRIELNDHTITGPAGDPGADHAAASGDAALTIAAADYDVEIVGPGRVAGGSGAVCEMETQFKYGADGGMGICLLGVPGYEVNGKLQNGLTVKGGAEIAGGNGAGLSSAEWQYNLQNYSGTTGSYDMPAFESGDGGVGIGQPIRGLNAAEADPAYYKIVVEDGQVKGGDGGSLDMGGTVPTYYALMNTAEAQTRMQGHDNSWFVTYVGCFAGASVGCGGNGIDVGAGRKYVSIDDDGTVLGGNSGGADYGQYKTIHRFSKGTADAGDGIAVYGDIGLTDDAVDFSSWQTKTKDSDDMGVFISGTVKGGDSPDACALNEDTCDAGSGISLHGETEYGNSSYWGIIAVGDGGSVAGGDAGTAVSGHGGHGGSGIYEAYRKNEDTTTGASRWGTDHFIVNGTVTGGKGGTAYSNGSGHFNTSYSTMVYTPALSGSGAFGTGGHGFLFGNDREGVTIAGSGTVRSGDAGSTVDRGGEDVSGTAVEPIHVYPAAMIDTFDITAATQTGSNAVALDKSKIKVTASMTAFSKDPTKSTRFSCDIATPAGYAGAVYVTWVGVLYPSGGAMPRDIELTGSESTGFYLKDNAAYKYLAYPTYKDHPELNMNHYNYDIATVDCFGEDDVKNKKVQIYCYVLLEDGRWGKSNVMEYTAGQGWNGGSGTVDPPASDTDQQMADTVAESILALPALGELTLADEAAVNEARSAYENLTDAQKALVDSSVVTKLEALEARIEVLNQETADAIIELIESLPSAEAMQDMEPGEAKTAIETAIAAYNDLTDKQKKLVDDSVGSGYVQGVIDEYNGLFPEDPISETIVPPDLTIKADMITVASGGTYTGKAKEPLVTVKKDEVTLVPGKDYVVKYTNNINAGSSAKVTVTGKGLYSGSVTKTFKIAQKKITPTVTLSTSAYTYNGKVKKPTVTVKSGSTKLATSQYTATYASGRKNVGKYSVKVTLKGNYTGTKTVYFKINPKSATIKTPTAARKAVTVKWTKQSAKMSTARISGYQIMVATNSKFTTGKKTVNVAGYSKTSKKVTGLKGGKKYYVKVRTYKTISGTKYYSPWSKVKTIKTKK